MNDDGDDLAKWAFRDAMIGFGVQAIEMGLLRVCMDPGESEINAILHEMELACRDERETSSDDSLVSRAEPLILRLVKRGHALKLNDK